MHFQIAARCAWLGLISIALAPAAGKDEAERLKRLTLQLGSSDYAEREAAESELDSSGKAALEFLREATNNEDLEIRRRADALVQAIERRAEAARLLEPRMVKLRMKDVPLNEALRRFNAQTGFGCELGPQTEIKNTATPRDQRVTLDTGDVTAWAALEEFCRAAGMVEHQLVARSPAPNTALREDINRGARIKPFEYSAQTEPARRILLVNGSCPELPTYTAGPIRVRALISGIPASKFVRSASEVHFAIEASGDAKLTWLHFGNLRIEKAVDENGQSLLPRFELLPEPGGSSSVDDLQQWVDRYNRVPETVGPLSRVIPCRLALGPKPSNTLIELSGKLSALVQTLPEELVSVPNVGAAVGQTVRGLDGTTALIRDLRLTESGDCTLRVSIRRPIPPQFMNPLFRVGRVRIVRNRTVSVNSDFGPTNPAIIDGNGQPVMAQSQYHREDTAEATVHEYTLTCRLGKLDADAMRLVFTGPRTTAIDVPFELFNVPIR